MHLSDYYMLALDRALGESQFDRGNELLPRFGCKASTQSLCCSRCQPNGSEARPLVNP